VPIQFRCDKCNALLQAADGTEGKRAQCKCGAIVPVPCDTKPIIRKPISSGRIIVECACCHRRIEISGKLAGKRMLCTCGAYIQIETLHLNDKPVAANAIGTINPSETSVFDELTPLDWSPKQVETEEKKAFEDREEKVLRSYILKDRDRKNPAVAFGLMVLMAIVNFTFAVLFWLLAWFLQAYPDYAETIQEKYPTALPDRAQTVFLLNGLVSMLTALCVLIPFSAFWWMVAFILSTSTSIRILELIHYFWTVGFAERIPRAPIITLSIVLLMTIYFFGQDARDYFRMRIGVAWAILICGSFAAFILFLGLFGMMAAGTPAD